MSTPLTLTATLLSALADVRAGLCCLPAALLLSPALASTNPQASGALVWLGDAAYQSEADIPAGFYQGGQPLLLENFEDRRLDTRLGVSKGSLYGIGIVGNGASSVDGDDGAVDGSGLLGVSWTALAPAADPLRFSFIGQALPTAFAMVVTAGGFSTRINAYDGTGQLIATQQADLLVQNTGVVSGDRFVGVQYAGGIRAIEVSFEGGWVEVDHVQVGQMTPVPEPGSAALLLAGGALLAHRLSRRRA